MIQYAFAPADPERVLSLLTEPATRIVSLTITDGGYNVDDKTGEFDTENPSVQADATRGDTPPHKLPSATSARVSRAAEPMALHRLRSCPATTCKATAKSHEPRLPHLCELRLQRQP